MNKSDLFRAFEGVDDDILERSEVSAARRKAPAYRKWAALAACMALAVGLAAGGIAAEAKEYSAAAAFFAENGLSMEGLSREDVKAVYRDITTQRFTYEKTAEVIERSVPGFEITQREPTPEELAALWNRNVSMNARPGTGISYRTKYRERLDETLGIEVLDAVILECYRDGELLWTAEFPGFSMHGSAHTSTGTAVWGVERSGLWFSRQPTLARVDEDGTVLWKKQIGHGLGDEYVAKVLDNGDGTWAVFSRGDLKYLCLSRYDADGRLLSFHKTEVGNLGVSNAARLGDGYLVQLWNTLDGETARLAKLDGEGNLIDNFTYEGEDCDYCITDMAEFGGRVYLSAYAVPKQNDTGGRHEIADILNYVFSRNILDISSEELTPLVRDNYTAVLLLCDPEGGAPETFYTVKGSLGGALRVNGSGQLEWDVESVAYTFFSPATNAFTIAGTCEVFRYAFDEAGNLLRQEDTGETAPYHR